MVKEFLKLNLNIWLYIVIDKTVLFHVNNVIQASKSMCAVVVST